MLTMIRANIRRQRGSFIGVLILIFIVTITLSTVFAVWRNSSDYEDKQLERIGFGDITSWVFENPNMQDFNHHSINNLVHQIGNVKDVAKVGEQPIVYAGYAVSGKKVSNWGMFTPYQPEDYDYKIYMDQLHSLKKAATRIKRGEVYVTPSFCSLYNTKIGDKIEVNLTESENMTLTIAGFFEDPIMASSMMGMKTMLVNTDDFDQAVRKTIPGIKGNAKAGEMLHIFKDSKSTLSTGELQSKINHETDLSELSSFTYQKSNILGFMLMLQNIFAGFLFVFVVILLFAAMIVLGHSISSSIEQDYVNMGILKAIGYTGRKLRLLQLGQYIMAILGGMFLGFPLSILLVKLVNQITVQMSGLLIPSKLPFGLCITMLAAILLILTVFICLKTMRIDKITPMKAIRNGAEDIYFQSRLTAPIFQKGQSFWMALRQLTAGKKQYISAGLVTVLLVFFLSLVGRIGAWMGPDGEGMMNSFGAANYQLGVYYRDNKDIVSEVEKRIKEHAAIDAKFEMKSLTATINEQDYTMNIISAPEEYNMLKGRSCKYENEIVMTDITAKNLKLKIGDTVKVGYLGKNAGYTISGIYQCANDMGANFGMSRRGFQRINDDQNSYFTLYRLSDTSKKQAVINDLKDNYGDKIDIDENTWSGLDVILSAFHALYALMYVIDVIFILVVIVLTGNKILYKERQDMGIYKSLGFSSSKLRVMFALRFGLVACIGSVLGVILSAVGTDSLAGALLISCGISHFTSKLNLLQAIWPAAFVVILFMLFAYFAAGKIRKVDPVILIAE